MNLDRLGVWRAVVIIFLLFAALCPILDYRDGSWLVILALAVSGPLVLLSMIFIIGSLFAILYRRNRLAVAATAAALMSFLGAVSLIFSHPESAILRSGAYEAIARLALFPVLVIPALLLVVPIGAVILALRCSLARNWKAALRSAAIPIVGTVLFLLSGVATGLLTVWSCAGQIETALQTVRNGGRLPEQSPEYRVSVLHTMPDVAVAALDSFMDFPEFIAFDTLDQTEGAVAERVRRSETPGCKYADAHKVWRAYYRVSMVC